MCVIILAPTGHIPNGQLAQSMVANPDGWGFAVANGGRLHVRRGLDREAFWREWERRPKQGAVLFHARITTHGQTALHNCHPFKVAPGWTMAHNGMIRGLGDDERSDTNELASLVRSLGPRTFTSKAGQRMLSALIGHSKLVFLHGSGKYVIVKETYGHWRGSRWYSNDSYLVPKPEPKTDTFEGWTARNETRPRFSNCAYKHNKESGKWELVNHN